MPPQLASLYKQALKSPSFTWVNSTPNVDKLLSQFEQTFPGIHGSLVPTPASTSVQQIVTEESAHKTPTFDVGFAPLTLAQPLLNAKAIAPINWASYGVDPRLGLKQVGGHGVDWIQLTYCIGYNTNLVKSQDVPQSWDAVGSFTQGTIAVDPRGDEWAINALLENDNTSAAYALAQKISKLKVVLPATSGIRHTTLASGQAAVGVGEHLGDLLTLKSQGAPVDWVPAAGVVEAPFFLYVPTGAPHMDAAKLFVAWAESNAAFTFWNEISGESSPIFSGLPQSNVAKLLTADHVHTVSEASFSLAQLADAAKVGGQAALLFK